MSYGLRVWDASGNLTLDVTDRITRVISTHSLNPGMFTSSGLVRTGKVSVPGAVDDGTWGGFTNGTALVTVKTGEVEIYWHDWLTGYSVTRPTILTVFRW